MHLLIFVLTITILTAGEIYKSSYHNYTVEIVTKGLYYPWSIAFLPSGNILISEKKTPALRLINDGKLHPLPIAGIPQNIDSSGQGGLLDVLVHPNFENNKTIFLSYSGAGLGGKGTEVIRATLQDHQLVNIQKIFSMEPKTKGSLHYGSRLVFAPDGTLLITLGDRYYHMKDAQNLENHLGKVVRINEDGTTPKNNPFFSHKKYKPEIYSYGHRNGQGLTLRKSDGTIWMHEHGPKGGDEVNILDEPGANYGWPAITYGIDYSGAMISKYTSATGMKQPVTYWVPSIAPCGMSFYNADKFKNWKDDLFVGALRGSHIRRLRLKGLKVVEQEQLIQGYGRIRDISEGPDGLIYFITDSHDGELARLIPIE